MSEGKFETGSRGGELFYVKNLNCKDIYDSYFLGFD